MSVSPSWQATAAYNSAAVVSRGILAGVYRKRHPAIRQSVHRAGEDSPVFNSDGLCFGVLLCYDSTFPDLDVDLVSRGTPVLVVPTNNALPESKSPSATPLVRHDRGRGRRHYGALGQ